MKHTTNQGERHGVEWENLKYELCTKKPYTSIRWDGIPDCHMPLEHTMPADLEFISVVTRRKFGVRFFLLSPSIHNKNERKIPLIVSLKKIAQCIPHAYTFTWIHRICCCSDKEKNRTRTRAFCPGIKMCFYAFAHQSWGTLDANSGCICVPFYNFAPLFWETFPF